jgi:hypothetical protein
MGFGGVAAGSVATRNARLIKQIERSAALARSLLFARKDAAIGSALGVAENTPAGEFLGGPHALCFAPRYGSLATDTAGQ